MTLKDKIDALKEAAESPMSRDPTSPFQRFRQKKVDERIDDLFNRGVKPPETKQEDYHIQKFVQKGIKVKPQRPGIKSYNRMVSAQENKEKLRQLFATEETAIEDFKKLKTKDKQNFSFDPRSNKIISDSEARKVYGKPGISMHYIPVTDNEGDVDNLTDEWKKRHSTKEAKERPPHFIGVWHDEKGKKFTDISYILNSNDPEEVQEHLQKTNQRFTYTVHPDMRTETIANKKYKEKTAQVINLEDQQPLHILLQGKRYAHMGKLDVGKLNYDEVDPLKDKNIISVVLVNDSESELYKFGLDTNIPKDSYKINFPYKIASKERGIATLFLMGSKINSIPKDEPIRLKFTYKEKEV